MKKYTPKKRKVTPLQAAERYVEFCLTGNHDKAAILAIKLAFLHGLELVSEGTIDGSKDAAETILKESSKPS